MSTPKCERCNRINLPTKAFRFKNREARFCTNCAAQVEASHPGEELEYIRGSSDEGIEGAESSSDSESGPPAAGVAPTDDSDADESESE